MNPFANYRYINAEEIIKANIHPNTITKDSSTLLDALRPLEYLASPTSQKAANLHRNVIKKLNDKPNTLKLLKGLGYELSGHGECVYRAPSSDDEIRRRENVMYEFQRFYGDIKKIKAGTLDGFDDYIQDEPSEPPTPIDEPDVFYIAEEPQAPKPSRSSVRQSSPSRLPDYNTVQRNNDRNLETVRALKESISPKHAGHVAHSFIRRKLLSQLFQQKYPDAMAVGEQEIDMDIDRRIGNLRAADRNPSTTFSSEVYFECLLRTHFEHGSAVNMLNNNRPNLQPPPEPASSRGPNTTTLADGLHSIEQKWVHINEYVRQHGGDQILLHAGDEWKNTVHVVAGIIDLRKQLAKQPENTHIVLRMYRLLFSELSIVIGPQSDVKLQIIANCLCNAPAESVEQITMVDIRDIVLACDNDRVSDYFEETVKKMLSTDCPICLNSCPNSRIETMWLCSHKFCIDCVKKHYRETIKIIKDRESLKKLTCCDGEHEISEETNLFFFNTLGTKLNQWFSDERRVLDQYQENLYHATRGSKDKKCGNSKCLAFFYHENNNVARAECPHCHFRQCQQCCRKWYDQHKNMTCEEYGDWLRENDPEDPDVQLLKYLSTAGMLCPNEKCGAVYEYQAGGCEHFTCPKCKTEFCRICSALFFNPVHGTVCPRPNCTQKKALHAHCYFNCFREIRDADAEEIIRLLTAHKINYQDELQLKPQATGPNCPVTGCSKAASVACGNRFCDTCYKQFLCLFVWRNQIEPWELFSEGNLRQKLVTASVNVPANAAKPALITLARQHLTQFLGKPKKIDRRNLQ